MVIIIPNSHEKLTKNNYLELVQTPGRPQWGPADSHDRPKIHGKRGKILGKRGYFSAFYTENADRDMGGGAAIKFDQNPRYGVFYCILLIFY